MANFIPPNGYTGGSATGNPMIDQYTALAQASGAMPTSPGMPGYGVMTSAYDKWRQYFVAPDVDPTAPPKTYLDRLREQSDLNVPPGVRKKPPKDIRRPEGHKANLIRSRDRARLEQLARAALLVGEVYLPSELDAIWQAAVNEAEASSRMGGEQVEPWAILEHWAADPEMARKYGAAQPSAPLLPSESGPVTSTSTSVALTTPEVADAVIRRGLHSTLGRNATDVEMGQFRAYLNSLEQANPTVTTQTTTIDPATGAQSTESATSGGAPSPTDAAASFLDQDEFSDEAFAYRMGTEGADILRALVGGLA